MAIGAALGEDTQISTRDGAEGASLIFDVRDGEAARADLLMHFPYPPSRWWDNPFCPCGNILFFTDEKRLDNWCERHARPRGAVLAIADAMKLSQRWFGDYASPDWRRKTADDAESIFEELGLDRKFWNISGSFR